MLRVTYKYIHENNITKQFLPREANDLPATQGIPCVLWNIQVNYNVHKNSPFFPILSHINPANDLNRSILFPPRRFFPAGFHIKNISAFHLSSTHTLLIYISCNNVPQRRNDFRDARCVAILHSSKAKCCHQRHTTH